MAFAKNMVLHLRDIGLVRILWASGAEEATWYLPLDDEQALPELVSRSRLSEMFVDNNARVQADQALLQLPSDGQLTEAERRVRDKAWGLVKELVENEPDIYFPNRRAALVEAVCERWGVSRQTVYKHVRRFWRNGCVPEALIPKFANCGAKGKRKPDTNVKRGRPRDVSPGNGRNVDIDVRRLMRVAWSRYYNKVSGAFLRQAYDWLLLIGFPQYVVATTSRGRNRVRIVVPDKVPTFGQFSYWYGLENGRANRLLESKGIRAFEAAYRSLHSHVRAEVRGPGSRYQIDATIIDVYLVSRFDPNKIVGRATLYIVIDVFSSMIVGFYLTLIPPCWVVAVLALVSTVEDKVALCARYGIELDPEEWPNSGMCSKLLADNAEFKSHQSSALASSLNVELENARPYEGAAKSVVESSFRTTQVEWGAYLPGYVHKDFNKRDAPDYRLDAKLTLDDMNRIVINSILSRNHTIRKSYIGDPRIVADNVPYAPVALWNWGRDNLLSDVRAMEVDLVRRELLPRETIRLTRKGMKFMKGLYYSSPEILGQPWYLKALDRQASFEVAYSPDNMNQIWVRSPDERTVYFTCELVGHSRRFINSTFTEITALLRQERVVANTHEPDYHGNRLGYLLDNQQVIDAAERRAAEQRDPLISNAARTRDIKQNRRDEIAAERAIEGEVTGYGPDVPKTHQPALPDVDRQADLLALRKMKHKSNAGIPNE